MEMGVRRAEAAGRQASASWPSRAAGPTSFQEKVWVPPSSSPSYILTLLAPGSPLRLNPPNWDLRFHSPRRFEIRDVSSSFHKAGRGSQFFRASQI